MQQPSYTLLKEIIESNPSITHFMLRLYRDIFGPFNYNKDDFSYSFISLEQLSDLKNIIELYEQQGFMVGLMSTVMTTKGLQSLLMLDFSLPCSFDSKEQIKKKITDFHTSRDVTYKLDGWIIQTNQSYHFLGKYVSSVEDYRNFLGSSLLFRHKDQNNFVIDDRWLGHQLKQGYGSIRLGRKDGNYPIIVDFI